MVEVPAALPGFSQKPSTCGPRKPSASPHPETLQVTFFSLLSLPLRSAMALLQLLEGWAGRAIPAGTHRGCPWKHGRAHGAARAANYARRAARKPALGPCETRVESRRVGEAIHMLLTSLPAPQGWRGRKINGFLVQPLSTVQALTSSRCIKGSCIPNGFLISRPAHCPGSGSFPPDKLGVCQHRQDTMHNKPSLQPQPRSLPPATTNPTATPKHQHPTSLKPSTFHSSLPLPNTPGVPWPGRRHRAGKNTAPAIFPPGSTVQNTSPHGGLTGRSNVLRVQTSCSHSHRAPGAAL